MGAARWSLAVPCFAGHLFVAAAGNAGMDVTADGGSAFPAAYNLPNMITVASTSMADQLSLFSNYGYVWPIGVSNTLFTLMLWCWWLLLAVDVCYLVTKTTSCHA